MNDTTDAPVNSQQHHVDGEVVGSREQGREREREGGSAAATEVPPPKSTKRKRTRKSRRREVEGDLELARPEADAPQEEGGISGQVPRREGAEGPPPQLEESLPGSLLSMGQTGTFLCDYHDITNCPQVLHKAQGKADSYQPSPVLLRLSLVHL